MHTIPTHIPGPVLIQPFVYGDDRGFFAETYRREWHAEAGIPHDDEFVQDNHSRSDKGVVRGLHFHTAPGAAKLVRCARGEIFDVVVDVRYGSPTFGQWQGFTLDDEQLRVLYVPVGFAHGFCVLSDVADVVYKQTAYYEPGCESAVAFDDPDIAIEWPIDLAHATVSERDRAAPRLRELDEGQLLLYDG